MRRHLVTARAIRFARSLWPAEEYDWHDMGCAAMSGALSAGLVWGFGRLIGAW